jgi:hypothetical protein
MAKVWLYETPNNNHGCRGFDVEIETIDDRTGKIVDGNSCYSCWQVGHNNSNSPIDIGTIVELPDGETWDSAVLPHGNSHNELVDDRDDPQPDCTRVTPSMLIIKK